MKKYRIVIKAACCGDYCGQELVEASSKQAAFDRVYSIPAGKFKCSCGENDLSDTFVEEIKT